MHQLTKLGLFFIDLVFQIILLANEVSHAAYPDLAKLVKAVIRMSFNC